MTRDAWAVCGSDFISSRIKLMSLSISARGYYSITMIQSGALFARQSLNLEKQIKNTNDLAEHEQLKSYVIAAIFSATAFLEATINEIFCDAAEPEPALTEFGYKISQKGFSDESSITLLGSMWRNGVPRTASFPITKKYQIALTLLGKEAFAKGTQPLQNVEGLVKLRNALIHYEPITVTSTSEASLFNRLNKLFPLHPNYQLYSHQPLAQLLAHGCAEWAIKSCIAFADDFFERIDIAPTFDHVRKTLNTR